MKKSYLLFTLVLTFAACSDNGEQKATERLHTANAALKAGDFNSAKQEIDSIKILYPKAFEARKEGIRLMQQIELAEQEQTLAYLDSMLLDKLQKFEDTKSKFILEKNPEYQDVGNYFWPTQTVEKNLHRSFLRFQVNETGVMTMTSIYCGSRNIYHAAVRVIAPDKTFAQTPASNDRYETTDLGERIEKSDYKLKQDGNVIEFIVLNKDNNIRIDYIGKGKYTTNMSASDRKAAVELYEFSRLLTNIEQIKKEQKEASLKVEFIKRNIERKKSE
jgi:hypothetical protein